jgi:hypothetical protein
LTGSFAAAAPALVAAAGLSSSVMPFLNALMPFATSPIISEILPRPNSSTTISPTTIQCQMLAPPMGFLLRQNSRGATVSSNVRPT